MWLSYLSSPITNLQGVIIGSILLVEELRPERRTFPYSTSLCKVRCSLHLLKTFSRGAFLLRVESRQAIGEGHKASCRQSMPAGVNVWGTLSDGGEVFQGKAGQGTDAE